MLSSTPTHSEGSAPVNGLDTLMESGGPRTPQNDLLSFASEQPEAVPMHVSSHAAHPADSENGAAREIKRSRSTVSTERYTKVLDDSTGLKLRIRREPADLDATVEEPEAVSRKETDRDSQDEWDDYCYSCNEGCDDVSGELGCCSRCPRVFHQLCHVPQCSVPMRDLPDDWSCTLCAPFSPLTAKSDAFGRNEKAVSGLVSCDCVQVCAKVLLACLENSQQSEPFRKSVEKYYVQYYKLISRPMDFGTINRKISGDNYGSVEDFVQDMNQVFINCSTFNSVGRHRKRLQRQ